jgi:PilZ domain
MSAGTEKQVNPNAAKIPLVERRIAQRYPILQRCFVWPGSRGMGPEAPPGWRCIAYNISETGIALALPLPIQPGRVLEIEPWNLPSGQALRVQVVRTKTVQFLWFCGCEWVEPPNNEVFRAWLVKPRG